MKRRREEGERGRCEEGEERREREGGVRRGREEEGGGEESWR